MAKPEIAIPQEASQRGDILTGVLRHKEGQISDILAQFSQITSRSVKAKIHLYTNAEQAKSLYNNSGPYTFEGSRFNRETTECYIASDIWLRNQSDMPRHEAIYWTQCWGFIGSLQIIESPAPRFSGPKEDRPSSWFSVDSSFLILMLSNQSDDEPEELTQRQARPPKFLLHLGEKATAEIVRHETGYRFTSFTREIKTSGYSIHTLGFADPDKAKSDVDAIAMLASFASRERSVCRQWNYVSLDGNYVRSWKFNFGQFQPRDDEDEPLLPRDREKCSAFLSRALDIYRPALHKELLGSAISALLLRQLPLELRIARYVSGIQGAILFALQKPRMLPRPNVGPLFNEFARERPRDFSDLWPLVHSSKGTPLLKIRNAIVHGEAFSEDDFPFLSFAAENLRWYLERIILVALGWPIEQSAVSPRALRHDLAYDWKAAHRDFKLQ